MRFLLDANLSPKLVPALEAAGHACRHVSADLHPGAGDLEVAAAANAAGAVLVSKDIDFVDLSERGILATPFVHVRLGNMSARATGALLLERLPRIVAAIEAGERIVEAR